MVNNPKALWENCLRLVKENVTEPQYRTWFEPIVFESYNEDTRTLLVQVPSMYVYEYLEEYYVGLLSKVIARCFGQAAKLTYRVVTDKINGLSQDVEAEEPANIEPAPVTSRGNKAPTVLDAAVPQDLNPQLDIHKTFQSFIEGDSNKLPRTVGLSIAEHPGKSTFNPFFVFCAARGRRLTWQSAPCQCPSCLGSARSRPSARPCG